MSKATRIEQAEDSHMCDCCAITGQQTPATETRPIPAGSMQYQTSAETTTVHLCAECARQHDEYQDA